jgi:hypothetical protein
MADFTAVPGSIAKAEPVVYATAQWVIILVVIRRLPRFVFSKIEI